jgi:hypothetical protein
MHHAMLADIGVPMIFVQRPLTLCALVPLSNILRITHAWVKTGKDWRIIGGMSMPEPETAAR